MAAKENKTGFCAFLATLFLGAFNDNVSKLLVICHGTQQLGTDSPEASAFLALSGVCFILPFMLFSNIAGFIADRCSKRRVMIWSKVAEILIMAVGIVTTHFGLIYASLAVLFFMGVQSAFFSPAKYGFLPETVAPEKLSRANGHTQLFTFISIILGGATGGILAKVSRTFPEGGFLFCTAIAVLGTLTSFALTRTPEGNKQMRFKLQIPFASYFQVLKALSPDKILMRAITAKAFFWFLAALLQLVLVQYAQNTLKGDSSTVSLVQAAIALGIGCGSFAAGFAARGRTPYHFVRPGALAMALVALLMFLIPPSLPAAVAGVILLGAAGGFFSLPTGIATQERPAKEMLGRCIATSNFLDCGAMILSSVMLWLMGRCGVDAPGIILAAGICILIFLPWTGFTDAAENPQ